MRRMPRAAVGVVLALSVVIAARWATGQAPDPQRRGQPAQVTILDVQPDPIAPNSLEAQKGELSLPIRVLSKSAAGKGQAVPAAPTPAKLPVKWGSPTESWETQVKKLETVNAPKAGSAKGTARPSAPSPPAIQSARGTAKASPSTPAIVPPSRKVTQVRANGTPEMTWRRPGSAEESEPRIATETDRGSADAPQKTLLRSERHWPPAYVVKPVTGKGKPGLIQFEEASPRAPVKVVASRSLEPAALQSRVQSICGSQARKVSVATQGDGTLLVTVKVDNKSIEDKLSLKILSLPEMTAPKVRLLMDVGP